MPILRTESRSRGARPPTDAAAFRARLLGERDRFTRKMLEAGAYVIENPQEVAFGPVSTLARNSGLSATIFVRLAQAMGFAGYSEMQRLFREPLRDSYPTSLQERIRHSQGEQLIGDPNDIGALARSYAQANIASLQHLSESLDVRAYDTALDLLTGARVIYVIGADRSYAPAAYLSYGLNRAGLQSVQITGLGKAVEDHAAVMAPDDVLVAISFPPYAETAVGVTGIARRKGHDILAITDSPVSPITDAARATLLVQDAELHGFRSLTALMCVVQTLVMSLAYRRRRQHSFDIDDINA